MEFISKSEKDTQMFAEELASNAKAGDIFALHGDLGTGKTTFSKAFAKALGIKSNVTSPTFVIMKEYPVKHPGIRSLIHVDCYRLTSVNDAESIGLPYLISQKQSVFLIEWPEKIQPLIKGQAKELFFSYLDPGSRKINY